MKLTDKISMVDGACPKKSVSPYDVYIDPSLVYSQSLQIILGGQDCTIRVYHKAPGLFFDLIHTCIQDDIFVGCGHGGESHGQNGKDWC